MLFHNQNLHYFLLKFCLCSFHAQELTKIQNPFKIKNCLITPSIFCLSPPLRSLIKPFQMCRPTTILTISRHSIIYHSPRWADWPAPAQQAGHSAGLFCSPPVLLFPFSLCQLISSNYSSKEFFSFSINYTACIFVFFALLDLFFVALKHDLKSSMFDVRPPAQQNTTGERKRLRKMFKVSFILTEQGWKGPIPMWATF